MLNAERDKERERERDGSLQGTSTLEGHPPSSQHS